MENFLGIDPGAAYTTPPLPVGTVGWRDGVAYMMVLADEDLEATEWCVLNDLEAFKAELLDTTSDSNLGYPVGVAAADIDDGEYGWIAIYGTVEALAADSCAAKAPLYATDTGVADDAAGGVEIDGAVATEAEPGSDPPSAITVRLNFPVVRVLVDTDT